MYHLYDKLHMYMLVQQRKNGFPNMEWHCLAALLSCDLWPTYWSQWTATVYIALLVVVLEAVHLSS